MRKLDNTETSVTIGNMTYIREVTETDYYKCMCFDTILKLSWRIFSQAWPEKQNPRPRNRPRTTLRRTVANSNIKAVTSGYGIVPLEVQNRIPRRSR